MVFFPPDSVCQNTIPGRIRIHPLAHLRDNLLSTRVGKVRFCLVDDLPIDMGIIDDHARSQMVFVMGLAFANRPKKRTVQGLCQGDMFDIMHRHMGVNTGLDIAVGIDMKIFSSRSNAPLGEAAIVPEVNKEHGFGGPKIVEPLPHQVSLFCSGHEAEIWFSPNRNVMEIPEEDASFLHQKV